MLLHIDGFDIELTRKAVKHINLRIIPPDGQIKVSAPFFMEDTYIENFIHSHANLIRTQIEKLTEQSSRHKENQISNGVVYLFGNRYTLLAVENSGANKISLSGNTVVLETSFQCSPAQREALIYAWYRILLKKEISRRIPFWEEQTGLKCSSWHIKKMNTKWGTCSTQARRLWFNLQLARKPIECIDYVILHEIIHIKVPNHQKEFQNLMSKYMPSWRERRQLLNSTS